MAYAVDVFTRHTAHFAQILGEDEIGLEAAQQRVVDRIKAFAGAQPGADKGIDFSLAQSARQRTVRKLWQRGDEVGMTAFVRNADKPVAKPERADHLGRRRQERRDALRAHRVTAPAGSGPPSFRSTNQKPLVFVGVDVAGTGIAGPCVADPSIATAAPSGR